MHRKRGQVAVFIIIALLIVAGLLLIFMYRGKSISLSGGEFTPSNYLRSCIEPELRSQLNSISMKGGYANPQGYLLYQDEKIKYLCYTSEYYKTCVVQQPLLLEHVESELNSLLSQKMNECTANLKGEYERRGYEVVLGKVEPSVHIEPSRINFQFSMPLTLRKESTQQFSRFDVPVKSEMYDLLLTSESIIQYESLLGDSETTLYLRYYPNLKIEKIKLSDGSKIYVLSNALTNEKFRFASRSLSWPPGYGLE